MSISKGEMCVFIVRNLKNSWDPRIVHKVNSKCKKICLQSIPEIDALRLMVTIDHHLLIQIASAAKGPEG